MYVIVVRVAAAAAAAVVAAVEINQRSPGGAAGGKRIARGVAHPRETATQGEGAQGGIARPRSAATALRRFPRSYTTYWLPSATRCFSDTALPHNGFIRLEELSD